MQHADCVAAALPWLPLLGVAVGSLLLGMALGLGGAGPWMSTS